MATASPAAYGRLPAVLRIGLTGGIGSGKSTVAGQLGGHGATVVDADAIAREVLAPGTPGLARVAEAFPGVVYGGVLDRPALAELVFADATRRRQLEAITHPLIGQRTAEIAATVPAGGVLVHDVPLLAELRLAASYHLVVVVEAPLATRLRRLTDRGLPPQQARDRIAHQASAEDRREVADVVLDNGGEPPALNRQVDDLWQERLQPYARNLAAGERAPRAAPALHPYDQDWPRQAGNLAARLARSTGRRVDHIGSTAVPGLAAKDVVDLMVTVADMAEADALREALSSAGFPRIRGIYRDEPKADVPDPSQWAKRLHGSADPGRPAHVHVRAGGTACWRYALAFRDWLRADAPARADYSRLKERVMAEHAQDADWSAYAAGKEPWFDAAWPRLQAWVTATGWQAPESVVPPA